MKKIISTKLGEIAIIEFGTRVVKSKVSGAEYPVYGGGGETFRMNTFNRENRVIVGRFAISSKCTRFVTGKFFLNDSGLTLKTIDNKKLIQPLLDKIIMRNNDKIYTMARGAGQKNLNIDALKNLGIFYPENIDEQERIVKILDKADEIRTKKRQANEKFDELLKSTFIDMFGDPVNNKNDYKVENLQEVTKFLTDGKHGDCEDEENSGYYFVSAKCINNGNIDLTQARQIKYSDYKEVNNRVKINIGDLLIVNTGATIGKMAIIRDRNIANTITLQKSVAVINMNNNILNSEYLSHCFLFKSIANVSAGSAIHNLLLSTIRAYQLPIPPIDLQNKFAEIVKKVEAQKEKNEKVITQMDNLFNSLMQQAFNEKL